jgi:hypothetical protein
MEEVMANGHSQLWDSNGRLSAMGQGVVISKAQLDRINADIGKRRAQGEDIPYVRVGSKVMMKLTPSDAIDSYAPMVIAGVNRHNRGGCTMR